MVVPLERLRAEVVLFLTNDPRGWAKPNLDRALPSLRALNIRSHVVACDVFDAPSVVNAIGGTVQSVPDHDFFVNVSTGSAPADVGGSMASMFYPVQPYYQPLEYEERLGRQKVEYDLKGEVRFLPTFNAPPMLSGDVLLLNFIMKSGVPLRKMNLMEELESAGVIAPKPPRKRVTRQALHAQTDVMLARLERLGFVRIHDRGKRLRIEITELGRGGARMFDHLLHPFQPLELLTS